jgi:RND superfamily putative drug exporter
MYPLLGTLVARFWPLLIAAWVVLFGALWIWAPSWDKVGASGQFTYLPDDAPSRRAEALFEEAFPGQRVGSTVIVVITRNDQLELTADDLSAAERTIASRLREALLPQGASPAGSIVLGIRSPGKGPTGLLLKSPDKRAALIAVELKTEFLDARNWPLVDSIDGLLRQGQSDPSVSNLKISLTGSAVLGSDVGRAEADSSRSIQRWTILVVVILLLLVYRAPLLALLPLITVFVGIEVALRLLGLLSQAGHLNLYQGVKLYVTVVGYGAGVDYCLFLVARCKEEWTGGAARTAGVATAVEMVGRAITASAATVVIGVAMMGFAEFGKIRQAGLGIAFAIGVVLVAALTLAPSLLCLTGRLALWPRIRENKEPGRAERFWGFVGYHLPRRPGTIWIATVVLMSPFAVFAAIRSNTLSYDLTRNLPAGGAGTQGLQIFRAHFPAGWSGPVTVLVRNENVDFRTKEGAGMVGELTRRLGSLGLEDIRSLAHPLGTTPAAQKAQSQFALFGADTAKQQAVKFYVGADGHTTRLDLVLKDDPLSEAGLSDLDHIERTFASDLHPGGKKTDYRFLGAASSMRDLKHITTRDRWRVDLLVVIAVFVVLLILLRRPFVSIYLMLTVVLGYLTTLGITHLFFGALEHGPFPGPDWKVPFFLFTILVAVGEDYNIFLLTRINEEQRERGPIEGVAEAVKKTGGVITSCGIIMAGTFASLFAGSLTEMTQMGFALALGILLDTLIVRPVLVPTFLLLLARWRGERQPAGTGQEHREHAHVASHG